MSFVIPNLGENPVAESLSVLPIRFSFKDKYSDISLLFWRWSINTPIKRDPANRRNKNHFGLDRSLSTRCQQYANAKKKGWRRTKLKRGLSTKKNV